MQLAKRELRPWKEYIADHKKEDDKGHKIFKL